MDRIINVELIRNPYNWIVVFLMLSFAAVVGTYLLPRNL